MSMPGPAVPGTPATDAQPTPSPAAQQGQGGQGAAQAPSTDSFWGMFPDVPQEMRGALEPHLKGVQGHVTKLEQTYAPYKPLVERGFTPEQVQNLVGFLNDFDTDPKAVWLSLGRSLLEQKVLHDDLDVDVLEQIVNGQDIDVEEPPPGGVPPGTDPNGEMPQWAVELKQQYDQLAQAEQQRQQTLQQQQEDQLMQQQLGQMRATLVQAGYKEEQIADEMLIGSLIAHRGDADKAVQALTGLRSESVRDFVETKTTKSGGEPNLPKGAPPVKEKAKTGGKRDAFADARSAAEQMLKQSAQATAQE